MKATKSERHVVDAVGGGDLAGIPTARELSTSLGFLVGHGGVVGREATTLLAELVRIGLGRSEVAPQRGDGRFRDPAWQENPAFRRLAQSYLAGCRTVDNLVANVDERDWRRVEKARFLLGILTSAAAPTNLLLGNPAAMKRAMDTGGTSLVKGFRALPASPWVSGR